jgi:3-dehydro-L-gulonate 2-dehydrogenase
MPSRSNQNIVRIPAHEMRDVFHKILVRNGVQEDNANVCADVFTGNSLDGVYTHGVNRFAKFISLVRRNIVVAANIPELAHRFGAIEQWNGRSGIGITNAFFCTGRAMEIARQSGLGLVGLSNTNHWMRAGAYARYAASKGFVFIGWSNTIANMPAWGAVDARLGNNPLVIAIPFRDDAIVLDMAMSQFSYGALDLYRMKNEVLPVPGGFDDKGNLSTSPAEILNSRRTLPIGFWKGSGLSLLLDILASIFSAGLSVSEISQQSEETNLSQVFIAIHLSSLKNASAIRDSVEQIIADFKQSEADKNDIRYPGEQIIKMREENLLHGIPVFKKIWDEINSLEES